MLRTVFAALTALMLASAVQAQPLEGRRVVVQEYGMPSPQPTAALRAAGASLPPGQALASVILADPALRHRSHRAGKTRCVF